MIIAPLDIERLRQEFQSATPFPHMKIDGFLEEGFCREVADSFPSFVEAESLGHQFSAVNERRKIQIVDADRFPEPIRKVHEALASPEFLSALEEITGIPNLLADSALTGGGMHMTGPSGRLDVHVDFNLLKERGWHRRLNILLYLNPEWQDDWGGKVELWDRDVKKCQQIFSPILNRCIVFETSEISFHGVTAVTCPEGRTRNSFAGYYYTAEAPSAWDGRYHTTVFKARPDEKMKGLVYMPAERVAKLFQRGVRGIRKLAGKE